MNRKQVERHVSACLLVLEYEEPHVQMPACAELSLQVQIRQVSCAGMFGIVTTCAGLLILLCQHVKGFYCMCTSLDVMCRHVPPVTLEPVVSFS
jgi:hypothetical protein